MTIQHIAMVYAAGGLEANEKHLLGAYCNHTDAHGYCWPGIDRLIDETGMSRATIKRVNAALKAKNLIRSVRRTNSKGESISNLTRVNVPLLDSLRRPDKDYGDNLIEIVFDDLPESSDTPDTASDLPMAHFEPTPGLNLSPPPAQSEPTPGLNLSPKTSVETSVETSPSSPPAALPSQLSQLHPREGEEEAEAEDEPPSEDAVAWVLTLPWRRQPSRQQRARLAALVVAAWTAGWTPEALYRELVVELEGARSLYAVWESRLQQLPAPPLATVIPLSRPVEPSCPEHPGAGRRGEQCAGCWVERYG
ncbi:helix-turn-helix domain-containing protein [Streptosporangium sandarakinum]|uniref:helix-turn-helix domain-containing protein n=1 Tax=Streptosporangium sandarakinum TaxID=1260955 RepID=UPI00371F7533